MRGVAGLSGWQWIFILEGILTFAIGMPTLLSLMEAKVLILIIF